MTDCRELYQRALRVLLGARYEKPASWGTAAQYAELAARFMDKQGESAWAGALRSNINSMWRA